MDFKKGSTYSRKQLYSLIHVKPAPPKLGNWDTLYVRVRAPAAQEPDELLVFLNINVAGRTGINFENAYSFDDKTVQWSGKPRSQSTSLDMSRLITSAYVPHFFARWDDKADFAYLGVGTYVKHEDGYPCHHRDGRPAVCIRFTHRLEDADDILPIGNDDKNTSTLQTTAPEHTAPVTFALEKYLEEFIVSNWNNLDFFKNYDLHEDEKDGKRKKKETDTGEIDIFGLSKDKTEYLVVELKKGRASDQVVSQILRYMNFIKEEEAGPNQNVKGLIIALDDDVSIRRSLRTVSAEYPIDFYKYEIDFRLAKA